MATVPPSPAATHASAAPASAPAPRDLSPVNWLGVWTLYKKECGRFLRVWLQTLLAPLVSNLLYMTVFVVVFAERRGDAGGSAGGGAAEFAEFLVPGLVMLGILNNASANTSSSLMGSKMNGAIVDVLMPPLAYGELAAAYIGGAVTRGLLVALTTAVALSFFVPLWPQHLWAVLFFGLGAASLMAMVGLLTGIWAEKFDQLAVVNQFVILPLSFLSGTFYSIGSLPEAWQTVSLLNPLFYLIDGFRYGFLGTAEGDLRIGILYTLALNAILFAVCLRVLKSGWRLKA